MSLKESIHINTLPEHIAIIMDGNGRWAKHQGKNRIFGHSNGVRAVREVTEGCAELGVKYLTLYAFSIENWNRPKLEVTALMNLLIRTIGKEMETLQKNNIRLRTIGRTDQLPEKAKKELCRVIEETKNNTRMDLVLALSYSGRSELVDAFQEIARKIQAGTIQPDEINESCISNHLYTHDIPEPELMIRTSGEYRISNFLIWQSAYTEFYFSELYWPEFDKHALYKAILSYQSRERRFGKTSEQIKNRIVNP